jgi:hypothetical protein
MAEVVAQFIEIEEDKTKTGASAGSPFLRVKSLLEDGRERTLRVFKLELFESIKAAHEQNAAMRLRLGDTEQTQYIVQGVMETAEPVPQPAVGSGAKAGGFGNPSPAARDSRIRAANIASAWAINRVNSLGGYYAQEADWREMIEIMQTLAHYFETGEINE